MMQLTKLRLETATNIVVAELPVMGLLPTDPYKVTAIDGLGPTEIDVHISNTAIGDGTYHGRRPHSREVVIQIGLNPDYSANLTPMDRRINLYRLLPPGDSSDLIWIKLIGHDGLVMGQIQGVIKRFETAQFSNDPRVQITIACLSPYWEKAQKSVFGLSEIWSNIDYEGSARTGFYMEYNFVDSVIAWRLLFWSGHKAITLNMPFINGDKLVINTQRGSRSLQLVRGGVVSNVMASMTSDSVWLELEPGPNSFTQGVPNGSVVEDSSSKFNFGAVTYIPKFWGF